VRDSVLLFGLSPVPRIRSGLRNPRKKERKKLENLIDGRRSKNFQVL